MPRKLKTYQTSVGFFDMAIAAPSMKAALEAWGSKSNLFHQGFAKEADDPEVVAATMAKPGVILRRPVGSDGPFKEDADLPSNLSGEKVKGKPHQRRGRHAVGKVDDQAARKAAVKAALAYEKEQSQRESRRRKEEAARAKARERREHAVAKAEAAFEEAERAHELTAGKIDTERAALERRSQAEDERWKRQKEKLQAALRRARG